MSKYGPLLLDIVERSAKAFVAAFIATIIARWTGSLPDLATAEQMAVAGVTAGAVAVLAFLSSLFGNHASGSAVPNLPALQVAADPPERADLRNKAGLPPLP